MPNSGTWSKKTVYFGVVLVLFRGVLLIWFMRSRVIRVPKHSSRLSQSSSRGIFPVRFVLVQFRGCNSGQSLGRSHRRIGVFKTVLLDNLESHMVVV